MEKKIRQERILLLKYMLQFNMPVNLMMIIYMVFIWRDRQYYADTPDGRAVAEKIEILE